MAARSPRVLVATAACLLVLNGCETSVKLGDLFQKSSQAAQDSAQELATPSATEVTTTDTVRPPGEDLQPDAVPKRLLGNDPNDDLKLGKKHFRAADFGTAEKHLRRAVEQHPRHLEAWLGLAASYDRLRRWDLADRAYDRALEIAGPTPEILNNQGYSFMLRGDYPRARAILLQAQAQDPANPYIRNNLDLLEAGYRKGKAIH